MTFRSVDEATGVKAKKKIPPSKAARAAKAKSKTSSSALSGPLTCTEVVEEGGCSRQAMLVDDMLNCVSWAVELVEECDLNHTVIQTVLQCFLEWAFTGSVVVTLVGKKVIES